jgi:hypothetical protein
MTLSQTTRDHLALAVAQMVAKRLVLAAPRKEDADE